MCKYRPSHKIDKSKGESKNWCQSDADTMDGHWAEDGHFLKNDHLKVSVVDLIYKAYERIGREPPPVKELLAMCPPEDPACLL